MQSFNKHLSNIYISNFKVNEFIKKLYCFKISNVLSSPNKKEITNLIHNMEKSQNGVFSYLWDKNIMVGILNKQHINNPIVLDKYKLELIPYESIDAISYQNIKDLFLKYFQRTFYGKLIIDKDHFYNKNIFYKDDIITLDGFQLKFNTLSNGKMIMVIDYKYKVLKKIVNQNYIEYIKETLKYRPVIKLFDSLSKRFVFINKITDAKVGDFCIPGYNIKLVDYLKNKYAETEPIDANQNVLMSGNYAYSPQFLYYTAGNVDYDKSKFFINTYNRYKKIKGIVKDFNLLTIKINNLNLSFKPFNTEENFISFKKPVRRFYKSDKGINRSLSHGFLRVNPLDHIFIYSDLKSNITDNIYKLIKNYGKERFNFDLPDKYIPLGHKISDIKKDISSNINNCGIIVISDNNDIYNEISELIEDKKIAFKMLRLNTAKRMVMQKANGIIENFLISFLLRAENIPWLLTGLNYNNYIFLDVGRGNANYVGYSFINDISGLFSVENSSPIKGEDLEYKDLARILNKIDNSKKSLIYIRDGNISKNEYNNLNKILKEYGYNEFALVEYKKMEPYRIFRFENNSITKPNSGDCIKLDENNYILVNTGSYEYEKNQGTPSTKLITFKKIDFNLSKEKILQDIHSLCYLNWSTPNYIFSDPAPLHFMDNLLNDYGKGIIRKFIPY